MKKLFVCVITILIIFNLIGCSLGVLVSETAVLQQVQDVIDKETESEEQQGAVIGEKEDGLNGEQAAKEDRNQEGEKEVYEEPDEETKEEVDKEVDGTTEDEHIESEENNIIREFNTLLPSEINMDLRYDKYLTSFDYLLVLNAAKVRKGPGLDHEVVTTFQANEKLSLISEVKGEYIEKWKSDSWHQVAWKEGEEVKTGFIYAPLGEVRRYQFEKMKEVLSYLKGESDKGELAHISNYKDVNGRPPLLKGSSKDEFGYRRSQSAAGYDGPKKGSNFRYIPDGMLVKVLEEKNGFTKVKVIGWEGEYWVQSKYINKKNTLKDLRQVIIVDRKFQNQAVFEFKEGQWYLISYGFATTGKNGAYSLETPLGYYMAIQKREKFLFFKDGTEEIAGYAPYAIRFSGGGYIHGVPVNFIIKEGRRIDPGMKEYLSTLGTVPLSHMCVRNYTSHAKFIYDWAEIGSSAVVIIE